MSPEITKYPPGEPSSHWKPLINHLMISAVLWSFHCITISRNWQQLQTIILRIVILVLPGSDGLESCLSLLFPFAFFSLLSVIPLNKMQLGKVVFARTFYTGIDSAGIQISAIIAISASKRRQFTCFLIIVEGRNAYFLASSKLNGFQTPQS